MKDFLVTEVMIVMIIYNIMNALFHSTITARCINLTSDISHHWSGLTRRGTLGAWKSSPGLVGGSVPHQNTYRIPKY